MKKLILLFLCCTQFGFAQDSQEKSERMAWFEDAKLGIFVHWGYYAVNGITESWSLYHKQISYADYMEQGKEFTASNYNPEAWAKLFKEVGADYAVLTTKHHDGVALWDTNLSKLNVAEKTPAGRDLVDPFVKASRKNNLKVGLYYSLPDWSHPDYEVVFPRPDTGKNYTQKNQKTWPAWERFVSFYKNQVKELQEKYNPDLFWFDGDWEHSSEEWRTKSLKDSLLSRNPNIIVNSRLNQHGDYSTPEQGVPVVRPEGPWEFCMTMNDNWGYFPSDTNYKPTSQIIRTFAEVIGSGGNLLLNISPKPDGTIPGEQELRLKELGNWITKNKQAVHGTVAGLPYGHFYGPTTISKDHKKIYLFMLQDPKNYISLKGIQNKVKSIRVLGSGEQLDFVRNGGAAWNNIPGILRIGLPSKTSINGYITVLEVELEGELQLYRGHGNAVELN
ncbi:alpha-L-fucosidase [Salegentibacter sp. LM13S]|uniref:alpha-L-fucosidase n=1 Tax=Salegentibacter lacus TaxID=2873599 RepID=UPI001CCB8E9B|nr:alpha-L-fucosidase [Salegentibacter lacus]MBZ9632381.1 alpha-L-fucosidase [Salegentibacter lacus]